MRCMLVQCKYILVSVFRHVFQQESRTAQWIRSSTSSSAPAWASASCSSRASSSLASPPSSWKSAPTRCTSTAAQRAMTRTASGTSPSHRARPSRRNMAPISKLHADGGLFSFEPVAYKVMFGSASTVSSANSPRKNFSRATTAIMAALSVHAFCGGTVTRMPWRPSFSIII